MGDALKNPGKADWKTKYVTPKNLFMSAGCTLLTLLAIVPIWNAMTLLQDSNYVFWAGRAIPQWIIVICVSIVFLYAGTVQFFFTRAHAAAHVEQTIMIIASIYITLFGLFLLVVSIPLTHQAELTYTNLLHRCDGSAQTQRLFEYSQVLQNMRATPACANKYSIEECNGYEEAAPYTSFLKGMENSFRCAGFCYSPPAPAFTQPRLLSVKQQVRHEALATEASRATTASASTHPPTLFSDLNFKASCEGMAARDMKNFAGDIGNQTFFQGIYLLLVAVATGLLKLMGMCMHKV